MKRQYNSREPQPSVLQRAARVSILELKSAMAIAKAERRRFFITLGNYAFRSGVPMREDLDAVHDATEVCIPRGLS